MLLLENWGLESGGGLKCKNIISMHAALSGILECFDPHLWDSYVCHKATWLLRREIDTSLEMYNLYDHVDDPKKMMIPLLKIHFTVL